MYCYCTGTLTITSIACHAQVLTARRVLRIKSCSSPRLCLSDAIHDVHSLVSRAALCSQASPIWNSGMQICVAPDTVPFTPRDGEKMKKFFTDRHLHRAVHFVVASRRHELATPAEIGEERLSAVGPRPSKPELGVVLTHKLHFQERGQRERNCA